MKKHEDTSYSQITGLSRESYAARLYAQNGFFIEAQNIRIHGREVDIIAIKNDVIHFVEVKSRKTLEDAINAITAKQLRRIAQAAINYTTKRDITAFQIDAVCFDAQGKWRRIPNIEVNIDQDSA